VFHFSVMKVENKGNTTIIKDTRGSTEAFLAKLTSEHKTFEKQNLILDVSADKNLTIETIGKFKSLSKIHRKGKKSFVIVAQGVDFTEVDDALVVVPTLLEANDMVEMEEIERDLGF